MAVQTTDLPLNRDEFCHRYRCSKKTFYRWIIIYELDNIVPNIKKIRSFTPAQSRRIIEVLG